MQPSSYHMCKPPFMASCTAGTDPERPLTPLPERLSAEKILAEAVLDIQGAKAERPEDLMDLISGHGLQVQSSLFSVEHLHFC